MFGFVLLGMLAAFGLVCAVWTLAGLMLPREDAGTIIYWGSQPLIAAQRHLWLREMGLTRDRLVTLECEKTDRDWFLAREIEICSREELLRRLEMGEKEIDTGA